MFIQFFHFIIYSISLFSLALGLDKYCSAAELNTPDWDGNNTGYVGSIVNILCSSETDGVFIFIVG